MEEVGGPKARRSQVRGGRRRLHRPTPYAGPPPLLKARVEGASRPWLGPEVGRATDATFFPRRPSRREEGGLCPKEKRPWAHTAQSLESRTYGEEEGELSLSGGSCELSLEGRQELGRLLIAQRRELPFKVPRLLVHILHYPRHLCTPLINSALGQVFTKL